MNKLVSNTMCINEPCISLAVASIAPYVDKCIIVDNGSSPEYLEPIYKLKDFFPNIEIHERNIKDGQGWIAGREETYDEEAGVALANLRREMREMSDSEWVLTLDSDELWPSQLIKQVVQIIHNSPPNIISVAVPFSDFCHSFKYLRWVHYMNRGYLNAKVSLKGNFPTEMDYSNITDLVLEAGKPETYTIPRTDDTNTVHHLESLCKPWRKGLNVQREYNGKLPEVLTDPKYSIFQKNILRWL